MVRVVHAPNHPAEKPASFTPDSRQAWVRLLLALVIGSIGSVGMWAVVVVIPVVQTEFAASRGAVSLAFTMMMFGFGLGGVIAGKITDRFGIVPPLATPFLASLTCWPGFRRSFGSLWLPTFSLVSVPRRPLRH